MNFPTKKIGIAIGAVAAVIIVAAIALPFIISADSYKGAIAARLRQATGRDVKLVGPLSLSFFPHIAVSASDVALGGAAGAEAAPMAQVKRLDVDLRLMPFLSGRTEISRLVLVNPTVHLEIDAQGRRNWEFGSAAAPANPPSLATIVAGIASGAGALPRFDGGIAELRIENGDITFADRRSGALQELQQLDLSLDMPELDAPFTLEASAIWHSEKVSLHLDAPGAAAEADAGAPLQFSLQSKPVTVSFKGTAKKAAAIDGNADLRVPSLRDFVHWAGIELPMSEGGFGPLALAGNLHINPERVRLENGAFAFDAIKAKGELTVGLKGGAAAGRIEAETIDLNPYLSNAPRGGASLGTAASDALPAFAVPKGLAADLDLAAQGLRYRQIKIGPSQLKLHLGGGKLVADINDLSLYQGKGKGEIQIDTSSAAPTVALNCSVSGVQLLPLGRDALGIERVTGAGSLELAATGRGKSLHEILASLDGKGSFHIANGDVGGVDLVGMLENSSASFAARGGDTVVTQASGGFTIARGVLRNSDLVVKTNALTATGAGTVNLASHAVDYRLTPEFLAGIVTVPVIVSGTWDDLSYRPDLAGIAKGIVQTPGRALGGAAGVGVGVGKGVGGAIQGIFGK